MFAAGELESLLEYPRPTTTQTLGEGLSEYYASHTKLVGGRGLSPVARDFFRCHDAAHVVFGCTTSLHDEALVKMWSFFGTTEGFKLFRAYSLPESREVYITLRWQDIVLTALRSLVSAPRVLLRCSQMTKRWPWSEFESHLERSLVAIRAEYGIRLVSES